MSEEAMLTLMAENRKLRAEIAALREAVLWLNDNAEIAALRKAFRRKFELFDGQVRLIAGLREKPWLWPEEQAVRRALEEKP